MSLSRKLKTAMLDEKPKFEPKKKPSMIQSLKVMAGSLPFLTPPRMRDHDGDVSRPRDDLMDAAARVMGNQMAQQRDRQVMESIRQRQARSMRVTDQQREIFRQMNGGHSETSRQRALEGAHVIPIGLSRPGPMQMIGQSDRGPQHRPQDIQRMSDGGVQPLPEVDEVHYVEPSVRLEETDMVSGEMRTFPEYFGPQEVHNISGEVHQLGQPNRNGNIYPPEMQEQMNNMVNAISVGLTMRQERPADPREGDCYNDDGRIMVFTNNNWFVLSANPVRVDMPGENIPEGELSHTMPPSDDSGVYWSIGESDIERREREQKEYDEKLKAKYDEFVSKTNTKKLKMMSAAEKSKFLKDAERHAHNKAKEGEFCMKCKRKGWIISHSDYRAKHGKPHEYPCPNCNPEGKTL